MARNNCVRLVPQDGPRGNILDRNNIPLALSSASFDILAQQGGLDNRTQDFLINLLGSNKQSLKNSLKKKGSGSFLPVDIAKGVSKEEAIIFKEHAQEYPSLFLKTNYNRFYPFANVASHIIGYMGKIDRSTLTNLKEYGYRIEDLIGKSGIEKRYDMFLRSEDGGLQVLVDHKGRQVGILGFKAPVNGNDITLTLDLKMQQITEEELSGKRGSVVIMDPYNGEIRAMASFPSFDPNMLLSKNRGNLIEDMIISPEGNFINRAISGQYPAGSIFKIILAMAALESGKANRSTTFICNKEFNLGSSVFRCTGHHEEEDLIDALTHSCNIYFFNLGLKLGVNLIHKFAQVFGIGAKTRIDLSNEKQGLLPSKSWKRMTRMESWYAGDTVNLSIGQGDLLVTPIQATRLISIIANSGYLVRPYLVKSINQAETKNSELKLLNLKASTISILKEALRNVVRDEGGSAHLLDIEELSISGKTGTAQVQGKEPHAWFVGYCPSDSPKLAFCVFLENGGPSTNACIVMRNILKRFLEEGIL